MPPLLIITAALGAMGSLQAFVHRTFNDGKVTDLRLSSFSAQAVILTLFVLQNKKVQQDHFNHLMDKRDDRIKEETKAASS